MMQIARRANDQRSGLRDGGIGRVARLQLHRAPP